tara:strand:- start:197 stop:463 length:267 start_codon:yes stop_codon:yes gene_type:complete
MPKLTLDDLVFALMSNGDWWTFWDLRKEFERKGYYFGEPSISAAIRNLRKEYARSKYGLSTHGEVIEKRKQLNRKGFEYKLIKGEKNG